MKKITLALTLLVGINMLFANPVDTATAKKVAVNFWKQNNSGMTVGDNTSLERERVPDFIVGQKGMLFSNFYILTTADSIGFVIVSADDRVQPILGYSTENTFDVTNMPPNLREWLMGYEQQIQYAKDENIEPSEETVSEWNTLLEGGSIAPKSITAVNPLLTTLWDQSPYYNELCPTNYYVSNEHTVTGCVATAMAQVMKYWNYPAHGSGYHSYQCNFGTQSANFAGTTYDWTHMPNQLTANSSSTQINAIATLMYHCGVSVDMDYGFSSAGGSGAYTQDVADALISYFRYDNGTHFVSRTDYSDNNWISLLKTELNAGRPIVYCGHGSMGGHAFVCDGYNNNNYFHFNWGWGGSSNDYYLINNLTPSVYNFSSNQGAVVGIKPSNNTGTELEMYSTLNVNDAWFGSNITGNIQILNTGSSFTGYMAVVIFNEEEIAVNGQIFSVNNLQYNYYSTGSINIDGGVPLIPGTYYAFAFYSEDGNSWDLVPNGSNAYPYTSFNISYSAQMETNSVFSNSTFVQGQSATVNVDVWNSGSQTFYGKVRVNLSSIEDGSFVQNIQVLNVTNGLPANYHYTNGIDFTGTITVSPGTYLMELAYQREGETQWYYAGSSNYSNPVFVTIIAAPTLSASPSSIVFQQSGGTQAVDVTTNVNWTATSSASWLTITPTNGTESGTIIVSATSNNSSSSRSATITITGSNGVSSQTITVSQAASSGIQPDMYEPNNTASTSYDLGSVNINSANYTVNANFHVTTDNDYYKINLPTGYSYTINANILNSYNNSNYSADAKFATSLNGSNWSSNYGSTMPALTITDGGVLYFRVLPYTDHEIGTYQLQIAVTRTGGVDPDIYEPNNTVSVAYNLGTMSSNSTSYTLNANFHLSTDSDYYIISLPTGYSYTINANILNSYNNNNFTAHAIFSTSQEGTTWSPEYGEYMPALTIYDGGVLYFRVLPYTDYETGTYQLQIDVTRTGGIDPDIYEPNNTVSSTYLLASVYENETMIVADASFHTSSDVDYYQINLPPDYIYYVVAVLFDHTNDPSYTGDAKIAVSTDYGNTWSSYGSYISTMTFEHSGNPFYKVVPQQDGTLGTYRLQISVSRGTGISDFDERVVVCPNPTKDRATLQIPDSWQINQIDIFSPSGNLVKSLLGDTRAFNVSDLDKGFYLLKIDTSNGIVFHKMIIQ